MRNSRVGCYSTAMNGSRDESLNSPGTFFLPWRGENYDAGLDGVRILILGESQYADGLTEPCRAGAEDTLSTCLNVRQLGIREPGSWPAKNRPFWTRVLKIVLGIDAGVNVSLKQRYDFWHSVAFYNYLQWWFPAKRTSPTQQMWNDGEAPFMRVVKMLEPDLVVAFSQRMSGMIPSIETTIEVAKHPSTPGLKYAATRHVPEAIAKMRTKVSAKN